MMTKTIIEKLKNDIESRINWKIFNINNNPDSYIKLTYVKNDGCYYIFNLEIVAKTINSLELAKYINKLDDIRTLLPYNDEDMNIENRRTLSEGTTKLADYWLTELEDSLTDDEGISTANVALTLQIRG